jgi:aromatic-L-amino-acid/L-tryptophan decarboxylase
MNNSEDFTNAGYKLIDWLTGYFKNIEEYPVVPNMEPGEIEEKLPNSPPIKGEHIDEIIDDFEKIVFPGVTHWQHPGFHAYFPANNSYPSILAEMLTAGMGVQGMKWITSPAATELERIVMRWLQQMIGLPEQFRGVIMDTASVATLCAILTAREKATDYSINESGFESKVIRIYCSEEAHSSIEKAVRIAGIGSNNLVKVPVDEELRMIPEKLEEQIIADKQAGYFPACVVGALGTTGTGAVDPIQLIGKIAKKHEVWFHIDAAYSGSALILSEFKSLVPGIDLADSFVFNPHKWMFTNFDCSAFFVRDSKYLTRTFSLVPEYLQTAQDNEIDFSNWGIQLGRRFRALKLWFVIRNFGQDGIQERIRYHIELGKQFEKYVIEEKDFELVVPRNLNIICFRYVAKSNDDLNLLNKKLLDKINSSGKVFLSHTLVNGKYVIRFVCGQTNVTDAHIKKAWSVIKTAVNQLH